jgi:hypothetical protein
MFDLLLIQYRLYKTIAKGYQQLVDLERSQASAVNETLSDEILYELKNCESTQVKKKKY